MFITSLKNQKEFDLVNKSGKKFHCPYFIAIITKDFSKISYHKLIDQNILLSDDFAARRDGAKPIDNARALSNDACKFISKEYNNIFYFGMKVGKKLSKSAVTRNKIKRRIRHLVRLLVNNSGHTDNNSGRTGSKNPLSKIIQQHNWGMIIIPRKGFEKFLFAHLLAELEKIFSKLYCS